MRPFKSWTEFTGFIWRLNSGSSELESEESERASDEEPFNLRELFASFDEVDVNESKLSVRKESNDSDKITKPQSNSSDEEEEEEDYKNCLPKQNLIGTCS